LIGLVLGAIIFIAIVNHKTSNCREAIAVMDGLNVCMETPGCFYDAGHIMKGKMSFDYYNKVCKENSA
jgi:hypothetical protein